jgi:hypothetical protein
VSGTEANGIRKAFAVRAERLYFLAFLIDTGPAFLAKPFFGGKQEWLDMNF